MNTRNSLSKSPFKRPVSQCSKEFIHTYFDQAREYIYEYRLRNSDGELILNSRKNLVLLDFW
jgi:hypothetical protein